MPSERLAAMSGEIFYMTDSRRIIQKAHGGTERILAYAPEDLTGITVDSLYRFPSQRSLIENILSLDGSVEDYNVTMLTKSGVEVNVTETVFVIRDRFGKVTGTEGLIREIHCPDSPGTSAGEYERILQSVIDSLPAAVCWKDPELRYMGCNRSFLDLAGFRDSSWIIGKKDTDLFADDELERYSKGDRELVAERCASYNYVETVYTKNTGEFRWFDITKSLIRGRNGDVAGIVGIHDDITTWVNAELGIQNRLWFEQQIMEISAGFINLSADEIDGGINDALEKIGSFVDAERCCVFNVDWENMRGRITHEWSSPGTNSLTKRLADFSIRELKLLVQRLQGREIINVHSLPEYMKASDFEKEFLRSLGVRSVIIVPLIKEGRAVGYMSFSSISKERSWDDDIISLLTLVSEIFVNVLDRKYMQEELMELYSLMEEKVKNEVEKNMENKKLLIQQSKLAAMGEMLGNIAHQWRQPLNALNLSFFELKYIKDSGELTDDKLKDILDRVNSLIQQMSSTVDDFRNFFRENKEQADFPVLESMQKALNLVQAFFDEHRIDIRLSAEKELFVKGYPGELAQVFLNILNNAKDALVDGKIKEPYIEIRLFFENRKVITEIEDNAGGINDDIIERIFEPYFTTKSEGKGTGIGLYMSKMIVENSMPGKLSVRNTDSGACFRIELPSI
jgi:PAS domain S-box-containing protein